MRQRDDAGGSKRGRSALAGLVGLTGVVGCLVGASGCVVYERPPPSRAYVVTAPPPPPLNDDRGSAPDATAVWVNGYWHWMGVRYAWIPGHWEEPPPGARWAAPRYSVREGAYTYEPGRWQAAAPPPPRP